MKIVTIYVLIVAMMPGLAQAASGAAEDSSGIFTWIFFGMVGLIMAVLLIPAVRMLRGLAGNVEKGVKAAEEKLPYE